MEQFSWPILIGGFAFFFLGLKNARKGLELLAGDRLRKVLLKITANRFLAFIFGIFITLVLQSSGATSAILVSFAQTGLLTLFQATAVLLGADIGTTFVVVLLTVKSITTFALPIVACGLLLENMPGRGRSRDIGLVVLGFGLLFYGMSLMTLSAEPLKNNEIAMKVFEFLADHPFVSLIFASLLSSAIHSAGTIGIAIALTFGGAISLQAALPIVLGANIGTCITAILASLGSETQGRRVALAHTLSKVIGAAVVFFFIQDAAYGIEKLDLLVRGIIPLPQNNAAAQVALFHMSFNVGLAMVFLIILKPLIKLVEWIIPVPKQTERAFGPKYLDRSSLDTPAIAFAQAKREVLRIASTAQWLFSECMKMFSKGESPKEEVGRIKKEDDKIDILEKAVRFYLAEISQEMLSSAQAKTQMVLVSIASDLEDIGDTMSRELTHLALKKDRWPRLFSDEGWKDLRSFQNLVLENFHLMVSQLAQPSPDISSKIERHEAHMNEVEQNMRQAHITRLNLGLKESFDTSSIHLDILSNFRRINTKITHITQLTMDLL